MTKILQEALLEESNESYLVQVQLANRNDNSR